MKRLKYIKQISLVIFMFFIITGCKTYKNEPSVLKDVVSTNKKVKVISTNNNTYYFRRLVKIEGKLYGITNINSSTAKKLDSLIERCSVNGKIAKIKLFETQIKEVYVLK